MKGKIKITDSRQWRSRALDYCALLPQSRESQWEGLAWAGLHYCKLLALSLPAPAWWADCRHSLASPLITAGIRTEGTLTSEKVSAIVPSPHRTSLAALKTAPLVLLVLLVLLDLLVLPVLLVLLVLRDLLPLDLLDPLGLLGLLDLSPGAVELFLLLLLIMICTKI